MNNGYDSDKYFLNKIRNASKLINEDFNQPQQTSAGEKVNFNNIKTVGFVKNNTGSPFSDDYRNKVIEAIGNFIEASGLILSVMSIELYSGRIIMTSDTINNPGVDFIKNIVIDTKQDNPKLELISDDVDINSDYMNFIGTLTRTYTDPKIGRNYLAQISQVNI